MTDSGPGRTRQERLKEEVRDFPQLPGVYLMKNDRGQTLYVGKAKDLRARVRSYFNSIKDHSPKTVYLVGQIDHIEYLITKTEVEAFLLEASLIKKFRPRYNIRLKDDKTYPYIRCSLADTFPRFYLSRRVERDGSVYFGPYTSGLAVRETIRFLNQTFRVRDCADAFMRARKRPCMTYQIGRCTAPCVGLISAEDYRTDIESALEFLRGRDAKVVRALTKKMKTAAAEERFEAAGRLRDSIAAVKAIWEKQTVVHPGQDKDQDVVAFFGASAGTTIEVVHLRAGRMIGSRAQFIPRLDPSAAGEDPREWLTSFLNQYYSDNIIPDEILLPVDLGHDLERLLEAVFRERHGSTPHLIHALGPDQKRLMDLAVANAESHFRDHLAKRNDQMAALEEIQHKLHLPRLPLRIECYDISNFQGSETVASQVVFEDGIPKREDYRRYRIKTVKGPDDFASLQEVLERRLKHTEYDDPDLILVDGGKGQLRSALEVLKALGRTDIPLVSLAKARSQGHFTDVEISSSAERVFLPGRQNPVVFPIHSSALKILTGLRDEAHRFAITYHRQLREEVTLASRLDMISGLGEKRRKILLEAFGSVAAVAEASPAAIASLPTFSEALAMKVLVGLAADVLRNSGVVGMPTETVYGLAASIESPVGLEEIFRVKGRPHFDPLIVHISDLSQWAPLVQEIPSAAMALAKRFWPGPLTIILPKSDRVPDVATSALPTVAVRWPRHPVAQALIAELGVPVAAPSANRFGRTSPTNEEHVRQEFPGLMVLPGGPSEVGIESTVVHLAIEAGAKDGHLWVLRPGVITPTQLRAALAEEGFPELKVDMADSVLAPGHLKHHYQPAHPLFLFGRELPPVERDGLVSEFLGRPVPRGGFAVDLSDDPLAAARVLYGELHRGSSADVDYLYCVFDKREEGASAELWAAIKDRLHKASTHSFIPADPP